MKYVNVLECFQGRFDHAVILTYNHDLEFYEQVIHPRLVNQGTRNIVILGDDREYQRTFDSSPGGVGLHYLVQPVLLPGAFHPKVILLAGQETGRLMVGSGNLTVPGYTRNLEVFTTWEYDLHKPDPIVQAAFAAAVGLIREITARYPLRPIVRQRLDLMISEAPWLSQVTRYASDTALLHNMDLPLLDQLAERLAGEHIRKIVAMSPYFDARCEAVSSLLERFQPRSFELITSETPLLRPDVLEAVFARVQARCRLFAARQPEGEAPRYPHAKWLLLQGEKRTVLVTGSANLTAPAWLETAAAGNLECVAITECGREGQLDHLQRDPALVLQEVRATDLACITEVEVDPLRRAIEGLRLLDVTLQSGVLRCLTTEPANPDRTPDTVHLGDTVEGWPLVCVEPCVWTATVPIGTMRTATPVRLRTRAGVFSNPVWLHDAVSLDTTLMPAGERLDREAFERFRHDPDGEILNFLLMLQRHLVINKDADPERFSTTATREPVAIAAGEPEDYDDVPLREDEIYGEAQGLFRAYSANGVLSAAMASILHLVRGAPDATAAEHAARDQAPERGAYPTTVPGRLSERDLQDVGRRMVRFISKFVDGASQPEFVARTPVWVHARNFRVLSDLALYLRRKGCWNFIDWADNVLGLIYGLLTACKEAPAREDSHSADDLEEALGRCAAMLGAMLERLSDLGEGEPERMREWRDAIVDELLDLNRLRPVDEVCDLVAYRETLADLGSEQTPDALAERLLATCPEHSRRGLLRKIGKAVGVKARILRSASKGSVTLHWGASINMGDNNHVKQFRYLAHLLNTSDYRDAAIHAVYILNEGGTNRRLHGVCIAYQAQGGVLARIRCFQDGRYSVEWVERINRGYFLRALSEGDLSLFEVGVKYSRVEDRQGVEPAAAIVRNCCISLRKWKELADAGQL